MKWNKVSEKELPHGEEVIAFNEKWIDEDFNPNGTRVGFFGLSFIDNKALIRYQRSICDTLCQIDFVLTKRLSK